MAAVGDGSVLAAGWSERPLLAIDSSTEQAGLALFDGHRVAELSWAAGRSQTATLLGEIHHLLGLNGLAASDLGAVAVATGPGTFTGLRVGVAIAKGLVLGLGIPLLGVSTLAAAAYPHAIGGRSVVPVVAAGRGRLVWAAYDDRAGAWCEVTAPKNGTVEELAAAVLDRAVIVAGELTADQAANLSASEQVEVVPAALQARRPAALAALAWPRLARGETDDPVTLAPIYVGR